MEEEEIIVCCDCGKDFVLSEGFKKLMIEKPEYAERDKK